MNLFRKFTEKSLRKLVYTRKLPSEFGGYNIFVTPDAGLRYLKSNFKKIDPMINNVIKKFIKRGDTIYDIGSNIGLFTISAHGYLNGDCSILSLEPDYHLASIIQNSIYKNKLQNISILCIAISDSDGFAQFNIADRARAASYLNNVPGSTQTGG
jgi:hypothetical protein